MNGHTQGLPEPREAVARHITRIRGFVFDLGRLKDSLSDRSKMLVLNSPQNPTGGRSPRRT